MEIAPGVFMPLVNLGNGNHTSWIKQGGRGIDTAYDYGDKSQQEVGRAVRNSGIPRSDLFVTTKLPCCPSTAWCSAQGTGWWQWPGVNGGSSAAAQELAESDLMKLAEHDFKMLGLDVIDALILHFPCATKDLNLARYRVLEELHRKGWVRAIGVSNFDADELTDLVARADIKPAVNQIGYSIKTPTYSDWLTKDQVRATIRRARELGVTTTAYGPLGLTTGIGVASVLGDPEVQAAATAHGKSAAQVALRYLVQQGIPVVTSGKNVKHYAEDVAATEFTLEQDEMQRLDSVD